MAMSVVYTTINGRLIQQVKGGQVTKFVSDTLGSVVAEVDGTGQITHTADYWPYGEVRTETGTKKSPFGFVGVLGYMKDFAGSLYVRARFFRTKIARWQTVDPLWPSEMSYGYGDDSPVDRVDPSGMIVVPALCIGACIASAGCAAGIWIACGALWGEPEFWPCVSDFLSDLPVHSIAGCIAGLLGCLMCVARYASKGGNRLCCPPPVKKVLEGAKDIACGLKRRCFDVNLSCGQILARIAAAIACITARLAVMFVCYGGGNKAHWDALGPPGKNLKDCLEVYNRRCRKRK